MTEIKDDTLEIDFVLGIVLRHDWVDEEILMIYEQCYRLTRNLMITYGQDTKLLDETRYQIMVLYGQI